MTAFRRRLRYHQAQWREAHGHPIGSQPIVPREGTTSRPVGSRLPLDYARDMDANFLTAGALEAARARTSVVEPHQSFDHQRLWADLLWSPTTAFNLVGDLAADLELAFLVDQSTFSSMTLEELLEADALPPRAAAALRERYLPG